MSRVQQILEVRDRRLRLAQLRAYGDNLRRIQRVAAASLPEQRSPERQSGLNKQETPRTAIPEVSTDRNSVTESNGGRYTQRRA